MPRSVACSNREAGLCWPAKFPNQTSTFFFMLMAALLIVKISQGQPPERVTDGKADLPGAPAVHRSAWQPLLQPIWQVKED